MKRTGMNTRLILFVGSIALLTASGAVAKEECTNATLHGSYGFDAEGAIIFGQSAFPSAGIGWGTFDGKGNFSGAQSISINGQISRWVSFTGQYEVNSDCTGTASHGSNTLYFVIVDRGREVRFIVTNQGRVLSFTFKEQRIEECDLATAEGTFGYTARGRILGPKGGLLAAVGQVTYDDEGNGVGAETFSLNGVILERSFNVTLEELAPNCTGSGIVEDSLGQTGTFDFVIVDRGKAALLLQTDPGTVITISGKRRSGHDN